MIRSLTLFLASFALAAPAGAGFYNVTNRNDAGPGSLRQGFLDANSGACPRPCRVSFQDALPSVIDLASPLPALTASDFFMSPRDSAFYGEVSIVVRGGNAGPDADGLRIEGARNVKINTLRFEGFSGQGLSITASSDIDVACDFVNNGDNGVAIISSLNVRLGGGLIAGNRTNGVYVSTSTNVEIANCGIGGNFQVAMGNGANGIHLHDVKRAHGAFNYLRNNAQAGIVTTGSCEVVDFEYNNFLANGLLGIDLGGDGVTADATPVIDSATYNRGYVRAIGHVHSQPNARVRLLFYAVLAPDPSGYGEGLTVLQQLGSFESMHVRTDANGDASFTYYFIGGTGQNSLRHNDLTATATRVVEVSGYGEMSEFSRNAPVVDDEVEYVVSNTADSGAGSLRDAIDQSNTGDCQNVYPCVLSFRIADPPPASGVFSIRPRSPLPALRHAWITVDGATQRSFGDSNPAGPEIEINGSLCGECNGLEVRPGTAAVDQLLIRDLIINGFSGDGILVTSPDLKTAPIARIDGCYIGTDATGTQAVPNGGSGIRLENGLALTGTYPYFSYDSRRTAPNLISGNLGDGIRTDVGGFVAAYRSLIGTDISGLYPIPNENGVRTNTGSLIDSNTISFNRDRGVLIMQPDHVNVLLHNSIHSNGSLGIDLFGDGVTENGTRGIQNAPEIISARGDDQDTRVVLRLDSPLLRGGPTTYLVTLYAGSFADASGHGEGKMVVSEEQVEGGEPSVEVVVHHGLAGKFLTATAIKYDEYSRLGVGTSSEFSRTVQVTSDACSNTAPTGLRAEDGNVSWAPVPGASSYILWSMKRGDMPRPLFRGTTTSTTLHLDLESEWWVEARFENCYGTQSEHKVMGK